MTQQFKRQVSLIVATDTEALDLSQLRIRFRIRQWDVQTPNQAQIRLSNVSDKTAKALADEFTRVRLQVGYVGGQLGTIFDGTIVQVFSGRESATDTYVNILAADGDEPYNFSVTNKTLAAGSTPESQAAALAADFNGYGVKPGYIAGLSGQGLPRGKVMYGMTRDELRQVSHSAGAAWSIQGGEFQVIPNTGYLPGEAVVLTSQTGLIGFPQQTQDGIAAQCLINPQIKAGGRVQIDNRSIQKSEISLQYTALNFLPRVAEDGFYRVIVINHSGDTRGTEWYSDLTCIAVDDAVTPGLGVKGYA